MQGLFELIVTGGVCALYYGAFVLFKKLKGGNITTGQRNKVTSPNGVEFRLQKGNLVVNNTFRRVCVVGGVCSVKDKNVVVS